MHAALFSVLLGLSVASERPEQPPPAPPVVEAKPPAPEPLAPSLHGARVIERGRVMYGLSAWYGLLKQFVPFALRPSVAIGLGGDFDLSLSLDLTMPPLPDRETMNAVDLKLRRALVHAEKLDTALTFEVIGARFGSKESAENLAGPRHATGLRDLNVGLGLPFTFGRNMTYSFEPFVMASIDLQPASNGPLTGPPPAWTLGWLVGLDAGYELRLAQVLGGIRVRPGLKLLLHTRKDDETVTLLSTLTISAG